MGPPSCVGFHISVCCSSSPWLSFLALCSTLSILLFSALSLLFKETGTLQPSLPLSLSSSLSLSLTHTHTHTLPQWVSLHTPIVYLLLLYQANDQPNPC